MKKLIALFTLLLKMGISMAQAPNMFNYQGVARDAAGNPMANKTINLRFYIREGSANGTIQFGEQRAVTTNANGLFSTQIGALGGVPLIGSMSFDWSKTRFLQIEIDANNTNTFITLGTQQLISVPYSKFSDVAGAIKLPYSTSVSNQASPLFSLTNSGTGASIEGINTNGLGVGVKGSSTASNGVLGTTAAVGKAGVRGEATNSGSIGVYGLASQTGGYGVYGAAPLAYGTGVYANASLGTAVNAVTASGTGVKTYSSSGIALDVSGKVKIAGGNTNPSNGAVLTSDASGNAVWKNNRIAFNVSGINGSNSLSNNVDAKIQFTSEAYDYGNTFIASVGSIGTGSATFTAPKTGVYHFDSKVSVMGWFGVYTSANFENANIYLNVLKTNGTKVSYSGISQWFRQEAISFADMGISKDIKLTAGDKVYISVKVDTDEDEVNNIGSTEFSGHLIFED